ncbi:MAG: membrane protein insertion efficiency factor YidD [Bacteroidota bacterium]|jgi:putative component of membrane protein insertase Oxa1/YidC/SpoIIIJ protein YidD
MRYLIVLAVVFYRALLKPFYPRTCLFRVSCSEAVLQESRNMGFVAGWNMLLLRYRYCRPGYRWTKHPESGSPRLVFSDGKYLEADEISPQILAALE